MQPQRGRDPRVQKHCSLHILVHIELRTSSSMTRLFYCFIKKYKNFYACDVTIKSLGLDNRDRFAGEKIPTLEEAVEECIKLQLTIYFDVKGHPDEVKKNQSVILWVYFICLSFPLSTLRKCIELFELIQIMFTLS